MIESFQVVKSVVAAREGNLGAQCMTFHVVNLLHVPTYIEHAY